MLHSPFADGAKPVFCVQEESWGKIVALEFARHHQMLGNMEIFECEQSVPTPNVSEVDLLAYMRGEKVLVSQADALKRKLISLRHRNTNLRRKLIASTTYATVPKFSLQPVPLGMLLGIEGAGREDGQRA